MRRFWRTLVISLFALSAAAAAAQQLVPYEKRPFSQAELDQMLAPIALYPDSLLSQILMAATYPQDVAEAASWSRVHRDLRGEEAVRAAEAEPWDPSVISLLAFPQVIAMMDERPEWTGRLGEAYLEQPEQLMDTVQELRARADAAGNLRTTEQVVVQRQGKYYVIEPPTPEVIYVPYYDPRYVYGTWWWPSYQPVYWRPWRGYYYRPGYVGLSWGYGIRIGSGFFFSDIDWRHRYLRYSQHRPWYFHGRDFRHGHRWVHDRDHRWRSRDPRWRDRDRDGRRDDRDGRWRDRDGRRDDRRDDRDRRGDRRDRPGAPQAAPNVAPAQQGFFPPRQEPAARPPTPVNPMARPAAPRPPAEAVASPRAPRVEELPAAPQPVQRAPSPRLYTNPAPREPVSPMARPSAPVVAPVPAASAGGKPAIAPAPAASPVARPSAAPAPAAEPERSEAPSPSSPLQRGGSPRGSYR